SAWPSEKCAARGLRCSSSPWTTTAGPSGDRFVVVLDIVLLHGKPKGASGPLQANGRGFLCRRRGRRHRRGIARSRGRTESFCTVTLPFYHPMCQAKIRSVFEA